MTTANALRLTVTLDAIDKATGPFRTLLGVTAGLSKQFKAARNDIRDLASQQKQLEGFRKTAQDFNDLGQRLEVARAKVKALGAELIATETPWENQKKEYRDAQREAKKLDALWTRMKESTIPQLDADMKKAGVSAADLASRQRQLARDVEKANARLKAQTERVGRLQEAHAKYDAMMRARNRALSMGTSGLAIGAAAAAPVLATARAFAEAEDAATGLKVSMMGPGGKLSEEFAKIKALAERLGDRLPGTTADFLEMMTMLRRQGLSAQNILNGTGEATAYLGVQLKMAPSAAAEFAAKLQDATQTTESDMLSLMDVIQRTFYLGVDSQNMLQGYAKLSPALSILRQNGLEAAKALAPLLVLADQSGMAGEAAGNAYRKIFQQAVLRSHSKDEPGAFGLDFTNGKGEFGGLDKLFSELDKLKGMSTEKRGSILKTIFGDDAEVLQALTILIGKGRDGYQEVLDKMQAQADLQTRVNEQLGTLKNLWEAAAGTFTNALVAMGESIAPELKAVTQWLNDVSAATRQFATDHPQFTGAVMKILAVVAILATGFGAVALAVSAILGPFAVMRLVLSVLGIQFGAVWAAAAAKFGGFLKLVWTAVKANPWALVIAGVAGIVVYLWQHWDQLKAMFKAGDWIGIIKVFIQAIESALDGLTLGLYSKIKSLFMGIIDFGGSVLKWIGEKFSGKVAVTAQAAPVSAGGAPASPLRSGGASGTWSTTNNLTVNAAPGQSPQDVGQEVRRQLDERDRQKAAQRRSIFADAY
jgi:TP901 family phage tail tape measure protein